MISSKAKQLIETGNVGAPDVRYGSILLAVDGSAPAIEATRHAVQLAKQMHAKLTAVFVDYDGEDEVIPEEHWPRYAEEEEQVLYGLAGIEVAKTMAEAENVPFIGIFLLGSTAQAIAALASRQHVDLIVAGDTGLTGFKHFLLGSFAEAIVKEAHIPVLVIKNNREAETP
ncbi:universal stress protein [Paenibacillus piri]|uniref:Universal stress protein n=1 Tax=Paenibacillus piri TaxID=2547395 RepID=A0A4V2ZRZ9_9BACL|nr:universal stress protein [Paenibacillus piri]TDF91324.1 universal stress protein [Paenibacillus piri]